MTTITIIVWCIGYLCACAIVLFFTCSCLEIMTRIDRIEKKIDELSERISKT